MGKINAFISMHQGEYREILVQAQNSSGEGINITNMRLIKWAMAVDEESLPVLEKSYPASGIRIENAATGYYAIVLSGVDTASLDPGTYYQEATYDLDGRTIESVVGTIRIRPKII